MRRNCSKNILLVILSLLFLVFAFSAVYLLIEAQRKIIQLDKYTEFQDLCTTGMQDDKFKISCPGLLLNISTSEERVSCFEIQIITKDNALKTTNVCEINEEFKYTNEILNYKKLLPIEIAFSYKPTESENSYQLENIEITTLNQEYIQNVVNQDIQSLTEINPTSTSIQNSVDFCPSPESLPNYITDNNKQSYSEYYGKNILAEDRYKEIYAQEFQVKFIENWEDPTIKIFYGCESSSRLGYSDLCVKDTPTIYDELTLTNIPSFVPNWQNLTNTNDDLLTLKNISLIYDGILYSQEHLYYSSPYIINELFQIQNDKPGNQNVFCNEAKLYKILANHSKEATQSISTINTLVDQNLSTISPFCAENLESTIYNKYGKYLKSFYTLESNTAFTIYEKCNNLYLLLNE